MPIFMDLHIIPGVKAKDVAEAHQQDLLIQNEFNCTCMTYWIDESRNSVFCLIEAPDANAVKELHNHAHGLEPHKIIPVNTSVVESFLGRIYDPLVNLQEGELKVFSDPAFRVLVLIDFQDPLVLKNKAGKTGQDLLDRYRSVLKAKAVELGAEIAEQKENVAGILSFTSPYNAIDCALALKTQFTAEERRLLKLKISISSGVPVAQSKRIFGDTIDLGKNLLYITKPDHLILTSNVRNTTDEDFLEKIRDEIFSLTSAEEKTLSRFIAILEKNIGDENFGIDALCEQMARSKSGVNRTIQALTGKTPNNLIKEYRLNKALQLLKEKSNSVSQVAYTAGFGSPSYFSKCFKEHFGISPSLFQDSLL